MLFEGLARTVGEGLYDIWNGLEKHEPEICIGLGVIGMGLTVVEAVRRGRKMDEVVDRYREKKAMIEEIQHNIEEFGIENTAEAYAETYDMDIEYVKTFEIGKERRGLVASTAIDVGKKFWSVGALFAVSSAFILHGYKILSARYLGAVAAFNCVSEAFTAYRSRVQKEQGQAWDNYYRTGLNKPKKVEAFEDDDTSEDWFYEPKEGSGDLVEGEDGELDPTYLEASDVVRDPRLPSQYAKFFGPESDYWTGIPAVDLLFLRGRTNMLTDRLKVKNRLILNEAYDALGLKYTPDGTVCGWVTGKDGRDCFVDIGYDAIMNDPSRTIRCKDGKCIYILDFNIDGIVWDKIGKVEAAK